jgi:hypothetical protein
MREDTYTNIPNNVLTYLLESKVSKTAFKLYVLYRMYKNNGSGEAFPSFRRIVKEAHISSRDLSSARNELVSIGVIAFKLIDGRQTRIEFNDTF